MRKFFTALAVVVAAVLGSTQAWAIDLTQIPRTIAKEPVYQTNSQKYCLLLLGPQARTRLWFVVDGKTAYLDRNGNGDLTEAGEREFSPGIRSYKSFSFKHIKEVDGTTHANLRISVNDKSQFRIYLSVAGGDRQYVGLGRSTYRKPRLAETPQHAPIIHLNGPMTFGRYGPLVLVPRTVERQKLREHWLRLFVGSRGLGTATFAGYNYRCWNGRTLVADIEFPSRNSAKPIKSRQILKTKG